MYIISTQKDKIGLEGVCGIDDGLNIAKTRIGTVVNVGEKSEPLLPY